MSWRSGIPKMTAEMQPAVEAALLEGAALVSERASARAPVGAPTVHLADEIHVGEPVAGPIETKVPVIAGGFKVFYAHMVEHGTVHSAPRPFLVPALEESAVQVVRIVRAAIGEAGRL